MVRINTFQSRHLYSTQSKKTATKPPLKQRDTFLGKLSRSPLEQHLFTIRQAITQLGEGTHSCGKGWILDRGYIHIQKSSENPQQYTVIWTNTRNIEDHSSPPLSYPTLHLDFNEFDPLQKVEFTIASPIEVNNPEKMLEEVKEMATRFKQAAKHNK